MTTGIKASQATQRHLVFSWNKNTEIGAILSAKQRIISNPGGQPLKNYQLVVLFATDLSIILSLNLVVYEIQKTFILSIHAWRALAL